MTEPIRIADLSDVRLDAFRSLRENDATRDRGLFVAEGTTVVQRLFESNFTCDFVLISDKKWDGFRSVIPNDVWAFKQRTNRRSTLWRLVN